MPRHACPKPSPTLAAWTKVIWAPLGPRALLVVDGFFWDRLRPDVEAALAAAGVATVSIRFGGEASEAEIERCVVAGREHGADTVIGLGGGKALDTGKIAAFHLGARIVTVPTIASTDSPTSSLGVVYSLDGVYDRVVRCGRNSRSHCGCSGIGSGRNITIRVHVTTTTMAATTMF